MIRSTFHYFRKFTNTGKIPTVDEFVHAYREAILLCVNYIWDLQIEWGNENNQKIWDWKNNFLDCPSMISTVDLNYKGPLSARALKCAATQACGIVQAVSEKRKKDLDKKEWFRAIKKAPARGLLNRLEKGMTKPDCQNINCELNSICMDVKFKPDKLFDGFIKLKSLWDPQHSNYPRGLSIKIPIKHYRRSNKWRKIGILKKSILLNENSVTLRWEVTVPKIKEGKTIAIDQGLKTCLTLSDGQKSGLDKHGQDLNSIINKLARKRSGSKAFLRACEHRKNYVNWSIKQINLAGVKAIKLEDIININYGRHVNRRMKHWVNTLIRDSVQKFCEDTGVLYISTKNEFNSQRCSICGWVQKSNRKGKIFKCKLCGHVEDSDFNASQNILIRDTLFNLPFGFRRHRLNLKGFFWKPEGLFDVFGQDLTVPVVPENELVKVINYTTYK